MTLALLAIPMVALAAPMPPTLRHALEAARSHNQTLAISRAQLAQQEAAVSQALAALTPTLAATGGYLRSEYQSVLTTPTGFGASGLTTQTVTIQPYNGFTASVAVNVPLVALGAYQRREEAMLAREVARDAQRATEAEVLLSTARTYYQVVAAQGVLAAAQRSLETAKASLEVARTKHDLGTETLLTVDRARVDLNRAAQTVATGHQALGVARRSLETLAGEPLAAELPAPPEPELPSAAEEEFVRKALAQRPEVAQARALLLQQGAAVDEAWAQFTPTLTGNATEHFTNAAGFLGKYEYWTAGVNLNWTLDPVGTPASIRRSRAAVEEQRHRVLQSEDLVRDEVHTVWLELEADQARLAEASSEAESAREALQQARLQYQAGTATSLDVSNAQRDAFTADATFAQVRADLAGALVALRKASGEPLLEGP